MGARDLVVALDGPGGVGKSTVARVLAERMGYFFLPSGIIYRAMAWFLAEQGWDGVSPPDKAALGGLTITVEPGGVVQVNGESPTTDLRAERISSLASRLSAHPEARTRSNQVQKEIVAHIGSGEAYGGVVLEGRDIGTVVFPEAAHKFYLTASDSVRAERRYLELMVRDPAITQASVLASLRERDERDATRDVAPMKPAEDAVIIDTSSMTLEEVISAVVAHIESKRGESAPA